MKDQVTTFLLLLAGIAGAVLRGFELRFAFDPVTGLAERFHPFTISLLALSAAVFVLLIIYMATHRMTTQFGYDQAFEARGAGGAVLPVAAAAALAVSALFAFRQYIDKTSDFGILAFGILAALAVWSVLRVSVGVASKNMPKSANIMIIIPIFWACFWLIVIFQKNAADPVIFDYIYMMLASIATTLFIYSSAGYAFGRGSAFKTRLFSGCAVYFSMVALLGAVARFFIQAAVPYTQAEITVTDYSVTLSAGGILAEYFSDPLHIALLFALLYGLYVWSTACRTLKPRPLVV